jgi:hypothetical protein
MCGLDGRAVVVTEAGREHGRRADLRSLARPCRQDAIGQLDTSTPDQPRARANPPHDLTED